MNVELFFIISVIVVTMLLIFGFIIRKTPRKLKVNKYTEHWKELQSYCKDKKRWPEAITSAEKLLERALKKRKYKGKTMGEMMVSAQKVFSDNDGVWFAHNLYKKLNNGDIKSLKEEDVKEALIAYRQALRDVGALPK